MPKPAPAGELAGRHAIVTGGSRGIGAAIAAALAARGADITLMGRDPATLATRRDALLADGARGRIVNVASTAGLTGYRYVAAYCAAKHGLVGLTRALALECAPHGVTVNAVCPGFTDTELIAGAVRTISAKTGRSADEARAELARANPQGRLIEPAEVAHMVAFLCQPDSGSITGQAIAIAGGEVMS